MSEHPLPDDELLSSHLDGDLTADERVRLDERLDAEPALRDRLAALDAARDLTRTPVVALAPVDADRIIAAALDASGTAANVTDLGVGSTRRRPWYPRLAAVAAVAVALALTVPALRAIDGDADDMDAATSDVDTAAFDAAGEDAGTADGASAADTSAEMAPFADGTPGDDAAAEDAAPDDTSPVGAVGGDEPDSTETTASLGPEELVLFARSAAFDPIDDDLGGFASSSALSRAIGDALDAARVAPPATTTAPSLPPDDDSAATTDVLAAAAARFDGFAIPPCAGLVDVVIGAFAGEPVVAADYAAATVEGTPVTVGVFQQADGRAALVVIDQATCALQRVPLE